jgi:hypothetical protein
MNEFSCATLLTGASDVWWTLFTSFVGRYKELYQKKYKKDSVFQAMETYCIRRDFQEKWILNMYSNHSKSRDGLSYFRSGGGVLLALARALWQRPERPRKMFNKTCFLGLHGGIWDHNISNFTNLFSNKNNQIGKCQIKICIIWGGAKTFGGGAKCLWGRGGSKRLQYSFDTKNRMRIKITVHCLTMF